MSKKDYPTRDDWDDSTEEEDTSSRGQPRPRHPRPSRAGTPRNDIQRTRRQLPPSRRFTPSRNAGSYPNRRQQEPQQSQRPQKPQQPQHSPAPPDSATPRRQPRDSRSADQEYEQYQRYRRYQQFQQNRQRDTRANDEEDEQYQRYQRYQQSSQQPRNTRQFSDDRPDSYGRQPRYSYDDSERYARPPRRANRPEYDSDYGEYTDDSDNYDRPARRSQAYPSTAPASSTRKKRQRRRAGSTLFIGCIGGIVTIAIIAGIILFVVFRVLPSAVPGLNIGASTYTSPAQTVSLPISGITQLQIQNPVGNISITVNPNAKTSTITYVKKTVATSQSKANTEFARMKITANPGSTSSCPAASCLTVTGTITNQTNDAINMMITLPPQSPSPTFMLSSTSQQGNISVQGFNGLLALTDDTGNITVKGGLLDAGSCLQDRDGSVSFAGTLETGVSPTINPCTGAPVSSTANDQPWYSMKTGTGNVDVTINTLSTSIQLDASINNQGKITSAFPLDIKQNPDGTSNYFGPLLPNTQPAALLTLTVDVSGNITLHKA